jgi:hypothetical protein
MQLNPAHHLDHRLQEIDHQINSALRDIRRNIQELEKASTHNHPNATAAKKDFSSVLQKILAAESDSAV